MIQNVNQEAFFNDEKGNISQSSYSPMRKTRRFRTSTYSERRSSAIRGRSRTNQDFSDWSLYFDSLFI